MDKESKEWPPREHVLREWVAHGLKCRIVNNGMGAINGYVFVPKGHPDEPKDYNSVDVDIHGGLTFRSASEDGSWFGFDTLHHNDFDSIVSGAVVGYRWTERGVAEETEKLALQLSERALEEGDEDGDRST